MDDQKKRYCFGENNSLEFGNIKPTETKLFICGINNIYCSNQSTVKNLTLTISGSDNSVQICPKCHLDFCKIEIWARNLQLYINDGGIFLSTTFILAESDCDIEVGKECLFADGVELRTGDGHAIYDISNGSRINPPRSILINDHVWLGRDVKIQKGVQIARNSVVGIGSIVTKDLVY